MRAGAGLALDSLGRLPADTTGADEDHPGLICAVCGSGMRERDVLFLALLLLIVMSVCVPRLASSSVAAAQTAALCALWGPTPCRGSARHLSCTSMLRRVVYMSSMHVFDCTCNSQTCCHNYLARIQIPNCDFSFCVVTRSYVFNILRMRGGSVI